MCYLRVALVKGPKENHEVCLSLDMLLLAQMNNNNSINQSIRVNQFDHNFIAGKEAEIQGKRIDAFN